MRIPISWLGELIDLPDDYTPAQLHADLVRVGFEEESVRSFEVTGPVVVGEVLSREPEEHSNGKVINWCQVRVGADDVRGIVCGAHNFEPGDKVVVALPGAVLPGEFAIAARKTYGHVSDGMIASQRELGLGDDHEGIIVLSRLGLDPEVGENALEVLGLDDQAVEINVTPDRGYAFSLRGVARELSHATGWTFHDPAHALEISLPTGFPVTLQDDAPIRGREGATGFVTRLVTGIDPSAPTPAWMVSRLQLAGIRSLGLSIDISNYVMLELGNPLHAYDYDKLAGGITVRRAEQGETLVTLDGQERKLHPEDLLITDESGAIGLAGVMGGESTKTDDTTTAILVEAALFDPVTIARTSRRHKLPSEASKRFERGVDPLVGSAAAQRMVDLLVELGGGTAETVGSDIVAPHTPITVELPLSAPTALVGAEYTEDEVRQSLEMIGCEVSGEGDTISVTAPSWRSDLTRKEDLIEEVARIVGYDRIPSVLPTAPSGRGLSREQQLRRRAANSITSAGCNEVQNYPFVSQEENDLFGAAELAEGAHVPAVKLANPLDGEVPFLRTSLIPGLAHAAHRNVSRGQTDLALVEFGSVFLGHENLGTDTVPPLGVKPSDETLAELNASIPEQPLHAAVLFTGNAWAKQPGLAARPYDWADALDAAKHIATSVHADLVVKQGTHQAFHPGRTAELFVEHDGELTHVGFAGEMLPEIAKDLHFFGRVAIAEVNLSLLMEHGLREPRVRALSTYPAATQDLTILVKRDVPVSDLLKTVTEGCGALLEHARVVDDFRGQGVPEDEKAITFALRFRATDRTLKAEEASEARKHGVIAVQEVYGAYTRED